MNSVTRSVTVMCSGLYKQNNSPSSSANRHIAPILKTAINFLHRRLLKCTFTLELNGFIKAPYRCENKFRVRIPVYIRQRIRNIEGKVTQSRVAWTQCLHIVWIPQPYLCHSLGFNGSKFVWCREHWILILSSHYPLEFVYEV